MARATLTSPMPYSTGRRAYNLTGTMSGSSRRTPTNNYYSSTYNSSYAGTSGTGYGTTGRTKTTPTNYSPSPGTYVSKYATDSSKYSTGSSTLKNAREKLKPIANGRPLPPGPGPLDRYGNKMAHNDIISSHKPRTSYHTSSLPRNIPMKADHSTGTYISPRSFSPRSYDTPSPASRPLSRARRTNSITDLSSNLDMVSITGVNSNLSQSKHYGSQADIKNLSGMSTPEKKYDKDRFSDTRSTPRKTGVYGMSNGVSSHDNHTDSGILPDIHQSGTSSITKSNSQERVKKVDDSPVGRRKFSNESSRHNSTSSYETSGYSSRSSPDGRDGGIKGLAGLRNLGNTCFMNSVLQCLSNTRALLDYSLTEDYKEEINTTTSLMKGALVKAYANLMKTMWKPGQDSVSPTEFKSQIARHAKRFVGYNQQDAQEFLIYLLEGLHEDLNRVLEKKKRMILDDNMEDRRSASEQATDAWKKYLEHDNSKIVDTFVGQLKSSLQCMVCGYVSNTFDPFWDLSLPIKKTRGYGNDPSLTDCFELFTQEETLEGDERPTCAKCKKRQKCSKGFTIQKFPKVLIIHLKRFNQESMYRAKLSTHVNFPVNNLDLTQFAAEKSAPPAIYNLYAVSNHSGTPFGGHYTACAKHPVTREWHSFNDQRVSNVSTESRVVSSEGYVLFYELSGTSSRL